MGIDFFFFKGGGKGFVIHFEEGIFDTQDQILLMIKLNANPGITVCPISHLKAAFCGC